MKTNIVLTGILKDNNEFLIVKRSNNDEYYPGAWEFPGGHLEYGETIKEGLRRELNEEIGYDNEIEPIITHYSDEIKEKDGEKTHNLEIDFIINVKKDKIKVNLSSEHTEYKWVTKDSPLLDEYIKDKLTNIK